MATATPIIAFESKYGTTRRYAEALAARVGGTAEECKSIDDSTFADPARPLIVLSPCYASKYAGVKFIKDRAKKSLLDGRRVAAVSVGMTLVEEAREQDILSEQLEGIPAEITTFYVPGRLNYSELSFIDRNVMKMMISMLKKKAEPSPNEQAMIESYGSDNNLYNEAELDAVVEWLSTNQ